MTFAKPLLLCGALLMAGVALAQDRQQPRAPAKAPEHKSRIVETLHPDRQAMLLGYQVGRTVVQHAEQDGAQRGWNGLRPQYYGEQRYYARVPGSRRRPIFTTRRMSRLHPPGSPGSWRLMPSSAPCRLRMVRRAICGI